MSINMMGTIGAYTKNLKMQTQWTMKKQSGDVTSHRKSLDEWLQTSTFDTSDKDTANDSQLRSIQAKLDAGQKLTAEERAYLKAKDPQEYAELEASEQEQRSYEQKLKRCKSKEEVQRLKMTHLGASLARVKSIENNSSIPPEKKLQLAKQEQRRCERLEESTQEFIRRGEYEKLPTDHEMAKAEQEEAARKDLGNAEKPAENTPEEAEAVVEPESQEAKEPDNRETEESPELRKTRRAKAKAAYVHLEDSPVNPGLDIKV